MKKIVFICVDYNSWHYTKKFLVSLSQQTGKDRDFLIKCLVVDNSTEESNSRELAQRTASFEWATYCPTKKNLGYFGGLNFGMNCIELKDWDFVVLCNNDLEFDAEFCLKLLREPYAPEIYAICPNVITSEGLHQNPHLKTRMGFIRKCKLDLYYSNYYVAILLLLIWKYIRRFEKSVSPPRGGCKIHMGIGAIYVLTQSFLSRFSRLDYPFFLYGEEAFFSEQIHAADGVLWFEPDLRVFHAESASTSKIPRRATYDFSRAGYSTYRSLL